jgi:DNA repair photolyase
VHIITKSALIERDLALLVRLSEVASVGVTVSVTFWDAAVARAIEPYAPPPRRRIETLRRLSAAGVPTSVNMAPLIPGLSDRDLIPILEAAREAGAQAAGCIPLRLPGSVAELFEARLRAALPAEAAEKVLCRVREMRGGKLNDPRFFTRMRGSGEYAHTLERVFHATARRLGFGPFPDSKVGTFRRPTDRGQLRLFD